MDEGMTLSLRNLRLYTQQTNYSILNYGFLILFTLQSIIEHGYHGEEAIASSRKRSRATNLAKNLKRRLVVGSPIKT